MDKEWAPCPVRADQVMKESTSIYRLNLHFNEGLISYRSSPVNTITFKVR